MIANYTGETVVNKKGEWGNNLPPAMEIETRYGVRRQCQNIQRGWQPSSKRSRPG